VTLDAINHEFAIDGHIAFAHGNGGLTKAIISNAHASAEVYLHGAHVTAFAPTGASPVLWMSDAAVFAPGKAIRGGIPVVWPWFGPHPHDRAKPQHGFARTSHWTVTATGTTTGGGTELRLELKDAPETRAIWPHEFTLELRVEVSQSLHVALRTVNTGDDVMEVGGALHTYLGIADIAGIRIEGLDSRDYIDKLDDRRVKRQRGAITIAEEVDRVYLDTSDDCVVEDRGMHRRIHVAKSGSATTVVWNPWIEKAKRMDDFPDEGFRTMVCVEATNTETDVHLLEPGESHVLSQTIIDLKALGADSFV